MRVITSTLTVSSSASTEFIDITDQIQAILRMNAVNSGMVNVFTRHTTAAIRITEKCDRLQQDMLAFFQDIAPQRDYLHDQDTVDDRPNARSHLLSLFLPSGENIPIIDSQLGLGTWQRIFFIELDGPREKRDITVHIMADDCTAKGVQCASK